MEKTIALAVVITIIALAAAYVLYALKGQGSGK